MRIELQELQSAPLALNTSAELLNATNRCISPHKGINYSKFYSPLRSGYNFRNEGRMSAKHNVFVLDVDRKPLTPTTNSKARKLLKGKVAKPIWNKFGQFGIQMLSRTRTEIPLVVLGQDWGTKFEGYSLVSGKENNLNIMWKLPDKKKLVEKLGERRRLRKARRFRNCRRRKRRSDNKEKKEFIAPSQLQIVNSRLKCMNEFFKYYPIQKVAVENVKFNHRDNKWGKNFSTVEVGKKKIFDTIRAKVGVNDLVLFSGMDTQKFRRKHKLKKLSDKSSKNFYTHCVDSFVIANELLPAISNEDLIYIDDNYRPVRRRLHDTQPAKGSNRAKFSTGNFKSIRKGVIIGFDNGSGQLVGGTREQCWYQDFEMRGKRKIYQKGKMLKKVNWLSHRYKSMIISKGK